MSKPVLTFSGRTYIGWLLFGGVLGAAFVVDPLGALLAVIVLIAVAIRARSHATPFGLLVAGCGLGATVALLAIEPHASGVVPLGVTLTLLVFVGGAMWSYVKDLRGVHKRLGHP